MLVPRWWPWCPGAYTSGDCGTLLSSGWLWMERCFHNGIAAYQQLSYWAFDAFLAVNNLMGFFSFCRLELFFGSVKHICLTGGLNIYSYTACSKKLRGSDFRIGTQGHVGSLKSLVPFALHSTCWMVKMVKTVVIFLDNCWVTNLFSIVKANSPSLSWRFLIF